MRAAAGAWLALAVLGAPAAPGLEVDPYLAWLADIPDSMDALNGYVNAVLTGHLQMTVERRRRPAGCAEAADGAMKRFHRSVFAGRRAIAFLKKSPDVVTWKGGSWMRAVRRSYYRRLPPLYVSSIAATVDLNGIRLSVDKVGHFFGFGRRYYRRYRRAVAAGATHEEAERAVVLWGIRKENGFVGKKIDTIFSHADLEANYQGFRFARNLCEGSSPYLVADVDGDWELARDVDLRDYVTPGFDEGYNGNHFTKLGWWLVRPELTVYCEILDRPEVVTRLRYYDGFGGPSASQRIVRAFFAERGEGPQAAHSLTGLCGPSAMPGSMSLSLTPR